MQTKSAPIKRSEVLVRFSQEHHFGLLLCWKIRQGINNNIAPQRIAAFISFVFENELKRHFREEESLLFIKLDETNPLRDRALQEHQIISNLMATISSGDQSYDVLNEFANTLEKHIRFEERTLFNELQSQWGDAELTEPIVKHKTKPADIGETWHDKFWLSNNHLSENKITPVAMEWEEGAVKGFSAKKLLMRENGAMKLVKVAPSSSYPEHIHPDKTEFAYVVKGTPRFVVGKDEFLAIPDEFYIFPTNTKHAIINTTDSDCVLLIGSIKD
ncbi:MAG: cupin domain-containing protein [Crocinitomicaceae bacterium]|nr:cupin domain-containing protein [Crocinitomicaceae bacterium]